MQACPATHSVAWKLFFPHNPREGGAAALALAAPVAGMTSADGTAPAPCGCLQEHLPAGAGLLAAFAARRADTLACERLVCEWAGG